VCHRLAQPIIDKNANNPFSPVKNVLAEEALLTVDQEEGRWSRDLKRIHAKGCTQNIEVKMWPRLKNRLMKSLAYGINPGLQKSSGRNTP
jgi:hypothetical protein